MTLKNDIYRRLLAEEIPVVTRQVLEWLLVNAVREQVGLPPAYDSRARELRAPKLISLASGALAEAVRAQNAEFGNFQLYIAEKDVLLLLVTHNFDSRFVNRFAFLRPDGLTACSRALEAGCRIIIEDVASDRDFAPHVRAAMAAGFRGVQSTPLKGSSGSTVAVLSTHFASPRAFSEQELAEMDEHAGQVSRLLAEEWD